MPIASHKPTKPAQVDRQQVQPASYKSAIVDNTRLPTVSLISYVEGAPWSIDYFSQVIGKDSELRDLDLEQSATTQTYAKVVGLELRVTSDLASSHNAEEGTTTVSGTAVIYPFLVPNIGDHFVGYISNNSKAIFRIRSVERSTFRRDAVYTVEYEMRCFVDTEPIVYSNLEDKVVTEYYYHRDRLADGLNPNVISSEHELLISLNSWQDKLTQYYFRNFFNREFKTLIPPGQEISVYDPHIVNFVLRTSDTFDAPEIREIKHISLDDDRYTNQPTLWTSLLDRSLQTLQQANKEFCLVESKAFAHDPMLKSIRYLGIEYVVYPINPDSSIIGDEFDKSKYESGISLLKTTPPKLNLSTLLNDDILDTSGNNAIPYITPVSIRESYIFSSGFYSNTSTASVLEALVLEYLRTNAISRYSLKRVIEEVWTTNRLEQFYYIPIILMLIKASIRS